MKKKLILIVSLVLTLALLLGGAFLYAKSVGFFHRGDITGYAAEHPYNGREIPSMHLRDNGTFVILKFTDTHFTTGKSLRDAKILRGMEAALERARPDLAVITGDMLDSWGHTFVDKRAALCAVADLFERRAQPWAYVPGNHDGCDLGSERDVAAYLAHNYEYAVLSNEEGLTGATQYAIPVLYDDGNIAHKLIFLDSLAEEDEPDENEIWHQESMHPDQVAWLAAQLETLKAQAPAARASVFFHFETPALTEATEPDNWNPWSPAGNAAIDDVIRAAGNVGMLSTGHWHQDHIAFQNRMYYHVSRNLSAWQITIRPGNETPQDMYSFEEIK
ncbi:MAG: metallophosphoesterase [Firmicutes bacterium]|nr:metallophosphoesterase [Bacillota bacterium]